MATFAEIGLQQATRQLFEGSGYEPFGEPLWFETGDGDCVVSAAKTMLEGVDFDLVYFPLKHLGYKAVIAATGELYAVMAHPRTLSISLGISAKLDFEQIKELWSGIVTACRDHNVEKLDLDLVPSINGLCISVSATGVCSALTAKRRPAAKSMDLICVSDNLGAAFFGQQVLAKRMKLEDYKQHIGAYLKPEINPNILKELEESDIVPSMGYMVKSSLAHTLKCLSRDSALGVKIYADKIPFEGNSFQLGKELDIDPVSAAMNGGEDFKLLFTIPILSMEKFRREFTTFEIIGHLAQEEVGAVLVTPDGVELPLKAQGWGEE